MKIYYLTIIYPDGVYTDPKRLLGVRDKYEAELKLGRRQRRYPGCKFEILEEEQYF